MPTHAQKGTVYLVGAGPGDPEQLTVRAAALLQTADAIYHDGLVDSAILALVSTQAVVVNVGKRCGEKNVTQADINALLIGKAKEGCSVVRLKIGDPMLFGRAGEEIEALNEASVPFEVVPGITAGFAAASFLRTSLTDRRLASKVIFLTGHGADGPSDWGPLPADATLVIYMPGTNYARLAQQIGASGFTTATPCIIVSKVGTPEQKASHTTLATLAEAEPLAAPCIVLAGAALHISSI